MSEPKAKITYNKRGSTASYLVGFVLSLVFTILPYILVVHKTITGNGLVLALLGFASLQMLIQIFFFLHLGRGPKPFYNVVFFIATVGIIVLAVGGSLFIMDNLYRNMSPQQATQKLAQDEGIAQVGGKKTGACQEIMANHIVTINDDKATPTLISAHLCDTLTFISQDKLIHEIAFGTHPGHEAYAGQGEEVVRQGRPKTVTLNQPGNYVFHDHLHPSITGQFSVEP